MPGGLVVATVISPARPSEGMRCRSRRCEHACVALDVEGPGQAALQEPPRRSSPVLTEISPTLPVQPAHYFSRSSLSMAAQSRRSASEASGSDDEYDGFGLDDLMPVRLPPLPRPFALTCQATGIAVTRAVQLCNV